MKTVRILGHPVHRILIAFPIGLLMTAAIFDIFHLVTGSMAWTSVAMYLIGGGVIGGLFAAVFGAIDWWHIPDATRAKRVGAVHGVGNVIVVLLFIGSWYLRNESFAPTTLAYVLSFMGVGIAAFTAWLGGELVTRHGIGIDLGANVDAPSSMSSPFASETLTEIHREERIRRAS